MSSVIAELPVVTAVADGSIAQAHGICVGDQVLSINGVVPRDLIEWQILVADFPLEIVLLRGNTEMTVHVESDRDSQSALPFGVDVHSALFDRIQTCDNHCEFCFIYQLPKGMRRSLYLKDDDYRLSFMYGNFTTLTRFTEADLERVVAQNLSPLYVSIHATHPHTRSEMLRNDRGGVSLRWLRQLLNHGIDVRAQIVLCPGVNDGDVLNETLGTLLEEMPELTSIAVVPLGLSKHNTEARMRVHTASEARLVIQVIRKWQQRFLDCVGRSIIDAADELYLLAGEVVPPAEHYAGFEMLEDGVGLVRQFVDSFASPISGQSDESASMSRDGGFFASVDKHDSASEDYRTNYESPYVRAINPALDTALRPIRPTTQQPLTASITELTLSPTRQRGNSLGIITGEYGAQVIAPLLSTYPSNLVTILEIKNDYFGGNTAVAGLLTFEDIARHLQDSPKDRIFVLPDVCLNNGRFLDGKTIDDLQEIRQVKVVQTSGLALRHQIDLFIHGVSMTDDANTRAATHG